MEAHLAVRSDVRHFGGVGLALEVDRVVADDEPHRRALRLAAGGDGRDPADLLSIESLRHPS
jgi:hypothetical protein